MSDFNKIITTSFFFIILGVFGSLSAKAAENKALNVVYLTQMLEIPAALSNLDPVIQGKGRLGAELATDDNNTTGKFTGRQYNLKIVNVALDEDLSAVFKQQVSTEDQLIIVNLKADALRSILKLPEAQGKLFFDAATRDDSFRNAQCAGNVLHLLPSRAMRADALAQYMLKKRWRKWFLVIGSQQEDRLFAAAVKRSAKKFGMKIIAEKVWEHSYDARRTAQSDVPVFTQVGDYDVLVVADEQGVFGEYLDYRTWLPRPVVGTQGLVATSWHRTHEQWGAVQMQNRFKEQAGRWMEEEDYAAYLAVRAIGEAAVRTQSNDLTKIKNYLLGDQLALQGYKGKALSFRPWNGQLRQPVLLAAPRSLVGAAPIEGFLHPLTEMDTLGYDKQESNCH